MNNKFSGTLATAVIAALAFTPLAATAQSVEAAEKKTPISTVIAAIAKRTGKKFVVDPRVGGDVLLVQEDPGALTYEDFLMLLRVHGFAAVANGNYVSVVPDANVRHMPLPQAGDEKHPVAEYVTKIVSVKSVPAATLVPVLRPLLPQQAHLVAIVCTNDLLIVDTFGNVQRLEKLIRSLDRGEPYVPTCASAEPAREKQTS